MTKIKSLKRKSKAGIASTKDLPIPKPPQSIITPTTTVRIIHFVKPQLPKRQLKVRWTLSSSPRPYSSTTKQKSDANENNNLPYNHSSLWLIFWVGLVLFKIILIAIYCNLTCPSTCLGLRLLSKYDGTILA